MADKIATGPYVIRNRESSQVIQIAALDSWSLLGGVSLWVGKRDEAVHRDRQIWWVEPTPGIQDGGTAEDGGFFLITNIASGKVFAMSGEDLICCDEDGSPIQTWILRRVMEDKERTTYSIVNLKHGSVVDIDGENSYCKVRACDPNRVSQDWELVAPMAVTPPGWLQIENIATGRLLSHNYLAAPPVLIPRPPQVPPGPRPFHSRETWATQWALIWPRSRAGCDISAKNTWLIKNRLTRATLCNETELLRGKRMIHVYAYDSAYNAIPSHCWNLELDLGRNWIFRSHKTSFLLEQTGRPLFGGTEVSCVGKSVVGEVRCKTWALRLPAFEMGNQHQQDCEPIVPSLPGYDEDSY